MPKVKQRQRRRATKAPRQSRFGRTSRPLAATGGVSPHKVQKGSALLAQELTRTALTTKAHARGGYPSASVMGTFLAPLKQTYLAMDVIGATLKAQPQGALTPACVPGCCACCRLYVEVGPWEAFGIADYVTQVCATREPARRVRAQHLQGRAMAETWTDQDQKAFEWDQER